MKLPSLSLSFLLASTGATADKHEKGGASPHAGKPKKGALHPVGTPKGGPGPLIIGGDPAPVDAYPWFVRFADCCGGTLISLQYVLSAAHCTCIRPGEVAQVGAHTSPFGGGVDAPDMNGGQAMESRTIVVFTPHPNYDPSTADYDYALVKLAEPVTDTMPVSIDGSNGADLVAGYDANKTGLVAVGLGISEWELDEYTYTPFVLPDALLQVDLDFVPQNVCNDTIMDFVYGVYGDDDYIYGDDNYPSGSGDYYHDHHDSGDYYHDHHDSGDYYHDHYDYYHGSGDYPYPDYYYPDYFYDEMVTDRMMCAVEDGKGGCFGDSGGPLWDREAGVLVGLVSWGYDCPNHELGIPDVFARISVAFPWIQRQVCAGTDDPASDPFCQGGSFAPTSSPYPTDWSTDPPTFAPTGAPIVCPESTIKVAITTDRYPEETSWELVRESDGVTIASKDHYILEETLHEHVHCVPMAAYTFTIEDSYGDGLCCEYGEGSYEVSMDGDVRASGGVFTYSESTTFGIVDVESYHALESGACAAPVWTRAQCKGAATMMGREWKGVISNRNKPYGCVIVSKSDKVAFNIKGNKWVACTAHTPCVCGWPYALEENQCDVPVTEPLGKSECEEAANVLGSEFVWKGALDTEDKPRGCFVKAKRKNSGKIKGGDLFFNENGNEGTDCKWGMPCVCSI